MGFWQRLFQKTGTASRNPAIDQIHRYFKRLDARQAEAVRRIPRLAGTLRQGADYICERVLIDFFKEYDERFQSGILAEMTDAKRFKVTEGLLHFMMLQVFSDLAAHVRDRNLAGLLSDAVHFEIFGELPREQGSFVEYLKYENPNFEDPSAAPIYKFGHDMAACIGFTDMNFPTMVAQQSFLVVELTKKLSQLALNDAAETTAPSGISR